MLQPEDLPFTVEAWTSGETAVDRVLARSVNVSIGRGAFERAVRLYPDRVIMLRDHTRVVESYPRE